MANRALISIGGFDTEFGNFAVGRGLVASDEDHGSPPLEISIIFNSLFKTFAPVT
jgi:hypothetical protein